VPPLANPQFIGTGSPLIGKRQLATLPTTKLAAHAIAELQPIGPFTLASRTQVMSSSVS
jgi:hypothetical protein